MSAPQKIYPAAPTDRIFSGVQPTGNLHLGNYLGAIRNWVRLQHDYEGIYCLVDMHAITIFQDPAELRANIREATAGLLASGIDPKQSIVFNQSQVPGHAELAWIFNCVARMGWLNRMTQFKDKAGKNRERASVGLFVYPNLMAADILLYRSTHVPVGDDQKQHLELARDIAQKFNGDYGVDYFPQPEPVINKEAARIMSLRDGSAKMSKSDLSDATRINLTDDADAIAKKIRKARTDPEPLPSEEAGLADRAEARNLVGIYGALMDKSVAEVCAEYGGKTFSDFKQALTEVAVGHLGPITAEMTRLTEDTTYVDSVLKDGALRARELAAPVLRDVHDIVGFLQP
jgi:tryptophanyl-tRNA synthetase